MNLKTNHKKLIVTRKDPAMKLRHADTRNVPLYLAACAVALALNALYRSTDASRLTWILAPTARWAGILGGLRFECLPGRGYVNETFRFLIAPSCSGIRFLQLFFLMLVFSYTRDIRTRRHRMLWIPFCLGFSYIATVFVNGLRIALSIHLPLWLEKRNAFPDLLTPGTLHTLIGTTVYFSALLTLQRLAHRFATERALASTAQFSVPAAIKPIFWYFLAVLAIPFGKRLVTGNISGFASYALIVTAACGGILITVRIIGSIFRRILL